MSPPSETLTLRSLISCRSPFRWMRTTRVSALPYRACASVEDISAPPVGRVGERAEQQRHVVMLSGVGDLEDDHDLGVERRLVAGREPRPGAERQPVHARLYHAVRHPVAQPAVA